MNALIKSNDDHELCYAISSYYTHASLDYAHYTELHIY